MDRNLDEFQISRPHFGSVKSLMANGRDTSNINNDRPCPRGCTCNFDTINCNDLIDQCAECSHWSKIDFNQIGQMKPRSFQHFKFSPNHTTHIIIYKLLNSTIGTRTFDGMHLARNTHVEFTFQYNSMIKFDKHLLQGVVLDTNATLVFNFPYTTQVLFMAKCFEGIQMRDVSSRVIIRIIKSFSVRFVGDYYMYKHMRRPDQETDSNKLDWSLNTGQLIIDIKSTHLVKFDEYSLARLGLKSHARLFIDLELVEKLMLERYSLSNLTLHSMSRLVFYAKQITFIDFKAHSMSDNVLAGDGSRLEVYLEELTSSLCLQRDVFSRMRLLGASNSFNFSVVNSKNVQLMHHSFANIVVERADSNVFVGMFNMPSYMLLFQNDDFFKSFLLERLNYLNIPESVGQHLHIHHVGPLAHHHHHNRHRYRLQYGIYIAPPFPANSNFYYNSLNIENGFLSEGNDEATGSFTIDKFYSFNKPLFSYNLSIEKNCFFNLHQKSNNPIRIVADNVHTVLLDDQVFNKSSTSSAFVLNVKHFVSNKNSFSSVRSLEIDFIKEPRAIKLGTLPTQNRINRRQGDKGVVGVESKESSDYIMNEEYFEINGPRRPLLAGQQVAEKIVDPDLKRYVKFWEFCISEPETTTHTKFIESESAWLEWTNSGGSGTSGSSSLTGLYSVDSFDSVSNDHSGHRIFNSVSNPEYSNYDSDLTSSWSSSSHRNSNDSLSPLVPDNGPISNSIAKWIGIIIICFVCGILLFMVAINIIQYKFRNDLFDDYECSSSQNITGHQPVRNVNSTSGSSHDKSVDEAGNCSNRNYKGEDDVARRKRDPDEDDDSDGPVGVGYGNEDESDTPG